MKCLTRLIFRAFRASFPVISVSSTHLLIFYYKTFHLKMGTVYIQSEQICCFGAYFERRNFGMWNRAVYPFDVCIKFKQ